MTEFSSKGSKFDS